MWDRGFLEKGEAENLQDCVERIRSVSRVSNLTALSAMISSQEELRHGDEARGVGATGSAVAS